MTHREQAEELRLALLMGLIDKADVIQWADALIMEEARPPKWLLDVSLAANESKEAIATRLEEAADLIDVILPARVALQRFEKAFRSGGFAQLEAAEMLWLWATSNRSSDDWDRAEAAEVKYLAEDVADGRRPGSPDDVTRAIGLFLAARHRVSGQAG